MHTAARSTAQYSRVLWEMFCHHVRKGGGETTAMKAADRASNRSSSRERSYKGSHKLYTGRGRGGRD